MSGLKRKTQAGGSVSLPNISAFPNVAASNVLYDFGNDAEGFYELPFFDGEEDIWKRITFKDFANSLKGALNIKYFNDPTGANNTAGITDNFIVIGADFPNPQIVFPIEFLNVPKIIHVVNLHSYGTECYLGYLGNDDSFNAFITSKSVEDYGVQSYILTGGLEGIKPLTSKILNPLDFFNNFKYFLQSNDIQREVNINTTDEFYKIPIFDGEEQTYKFTNLPSLSDGLGLGHLRNYREYILRNSGTYNIPIQPKELTRIILHEGCATQQINLAIDNVNLDFDTFEGTEIEVINFKNNIKTFIWGSQGTATTAFTVPASTTNNAVGVSRRFILLDTMWRQV